MLLFPAIDLYGGKAVRLLRGDYRQMTVYDDQPLNVAKKFEDAGAKCLHVVDLEGAKEGSVPHLPLIAEILKKTNLFVEVGGGIRSDDVLAQYMQIGVHRAILGTAAVEDEAFLMRSIEKYGDRIAVGIDVRDGFVSIRGWTENSAFTTDDFVRKMEKAGVSTIICTDISKDGAMKGTNTDLYRHLSEITSMNVTASGGVSTLKDIHDLNALGLYGAILGKALYEGAFDLDEALKIVHREAHQ
ncbi:MAG: 1-(5-phosphoribosyl)-5-[Clostridia bacterium]|nr:1-(5-phosphoribosyl)-5-[(5-phosphoribosylamino)methylideneamino]imidazole-4-carboxamide isomerase [Clostridia bacterium]